MLSTLDAKKITSSELHTPRKGEKVFKMEIVEGSGEKRKMFFLGQWV